MYDNEREIGLMHWKNWRNLVLYTEYGREENS